MIKKKMMIVVSVLISLNLFAQGWMNISPSCISNDIYMFDGTFIDKSKGWLIGKRELSDNLYYTSDGGKSWELKMSGDSLYYSNIYFVDNDHGWMKMSKKIGPYQEYTYSLWRTKNGGNSWQKATAPPAFEAIFFVDSLNGFSAGSSEFYKTIDGGASWQKSGVEQNAGFGIFDVFSSDPIHGWGVGGSDAAFDMGIILKTTDGGETWNVKVAEATATGMAVFFTDSVRGVVVGSNPPFFQGVVMKTADGGESWENQYLPCTWLRDVVFTDDSTGWIVGDLGFIWKTTDGGDTWNRIESGTTNDLNKVVFVQNGNVGYIFGSKNTLLRYCVDSNPVKGRNVLPKKSGLYPVYPNPFNGSTNIEYVLPVDGHISLHIYEMTGKEVMTLMDRWQPKGRHTVRWDGRNKNNEEAGSGFYVCRITSGSHSQCVKMCLIR